MNKAVGAHNLKRVLTAAGYGCVDDRMADMREPASRVIVGVDRTNNNEVVSVAHCRVSLQGELVGAMAGEPSLFILELAVSPSFQSKGLGKHIVLALERSARKFGLDHLMMCASSEVEQVARAFVGTKLKGFVEDDTWASEGELLLSKALVAPVAREMVPAAPKAELSEKLEDSSSPPSVLEGPGHVSAEKESSQHGKDEPPLDPTPLRFDFASAGAANMDVCEEDEDESDRLMDELIALYEEKHGEPPTEEALAQWRETLDSAAADAANIA